MDDRAERFKRIDQEMARHLDQTSASTPPVDIYHKPGELLADKYKVVSVLGVGGMGCVYLVEQVFLRHQYALKTIKLGSASDTVLRRFQNEARASVILNHPNLVRTIDFGVMNDSEPFLVMDLARGITLEEYLKENSKTDLNEVLKIFLGICSGLSYAHSRGITHRDLKPSNVMLESGEGNVVVPRILDFGIAKIENSETLTATGEIFGTPLYMSPEQCMSSKLDARSDIYSLGCMLFEALTGAPPFVGGPPL